MTLSPELLLALDGCAQPSLSTPTESPTGGALIGTSVDTCGCDSIADELAELRDEIDEIEDGAEPLVQSEDNISRIRWLALRSSSEGLRRSDRSIYQVDVESRASREEGLEDVDVSTIDDARAALSTLNEALAELDAELDSITAEHDMLLDEEAEMLELADCDIEGSKPLGRTDADAEAYHALEANIDEGIALSSTGLDATMQVERQLRRIRKLAAASAARRWTTTSASTCRRRTWPRRQRSTASPGSPPTTESAC